MEYTEREISIAKQLVEPDTLAFLKKVFVDLHTSNGEEIAKNVVALDDAEYGRLMKVYYLSKKENSAKLSLIQSISKKNKTESKTAIAPK